MCRSQLFYYSLGATISPWLRRGTTWSYNLRDTNSLMYHFTGKVNLLHCTLSCLFSVFRHVVTMSEFCIRARYALLFSDHTCVLQYMIQFFLLPCAYPPAYFREFTILSYLAFCSPLPGIQKETIPHPRSSSWTTNTPFLCSKWRNNIGFVQ